MAAEQRGPRHRTPEALLIDGLGTLVSLAPPAPALRQELAARFELEISEAEAERALAAEITFYRAHMGSGRDADSLRALRRRCAEVLRAALGPGERAARLDIDALTGVLLRSLRFQAFPDARPALSGARARGVRVVVVSNWDVSLLEVLELVGLAPLLDGVVTSAAVGVGKPAAAIFRHGLALAGVAPERAVHVGDSLAEDVAGARACGIAAVLLRRGGDPAVSIPDGVTTITRLTELSWP
jgi:putative hydrolase of the HAD superfamily